MPLAETGGIQLFFPQSARIKGLGFLDLGFLKRGEKASPLLRIRGCLRCTPTDGLGTRPVSRRAVEFDGEDDHGESEHGPGTVQLR